jgi:ferredoxin--NADP+ reductase
VTRSRNLKTVVSLNPIMVDATGMCGACRVSVGGRTRFVCVDGPEFDGHEVNFAELVKRQRAYLDQEQQAAKMFLHPEGSCMGGKS